MNTMLIIISIFVCSVIGIVITLSIMQAYRKKKIKKIIDKLEYDKNTIASSPINPELTKVKSFFKNDALDKMYKEWEKRLIEIKEEKMPKITDMLLEIDHHFTKVNYKNIMFDIAKIELELYKVASDSEQLLNEIKEVTNSEEKNREIITNLKIKYRKLNEKYTASQADFGKYKKPVEKQFEYISSNFELLEREMEKNNYIEVTNIIKLLDDLLKHMDIVIEEAPVIILTASTFLPKKIEEVKKTYQSLVEKGYPLDYLNIEYNIEEAEKKIKEILERIKELNLEDSLFETKILVEYFDNIFNDFEKEKINKNIFEESTISLKSKLDKINKLVNGIFKQLDEIKEDYDLKEEEIESLSSVKEELEKLNQDYKTLLNHTTNNTSFAYSRLSKEVENLLNKLITIEEQLEYSLDNLGNMKEDEARAHQQLEEIQAIYLESQNRINRAYLPVVPKNIYVIAKEASDSIKEIIYELNKSPIVIETLNIRVDTARDLTLKFYSTVNELIKTSSIAEKAIVYGNRYRYSNLEINKNINISEQLFRLGKYQESLSNTITSINVAEPGIHEKLLDFYK